jgi:hypothetical protein
LSAAARALRTVQRNASHDPQSPRRTLWLFIRSLQKRTHRPGSAKILPSPLGKTDPQSAGSALTARSWACMSLIIKDQTGPESGFAILSNLFILNNLAERVGFEPRLFNKINKLGGANGKPNLARTSQKQSTPHSIGRLMDADFFGDQVPYFSLDMVESRCRLLVCQTYARTTD